MSAGDGAEAAGGLPESPPCPFCEGVATELVNAFGSHASVSTYWCRRCRSPFEVLKWRRAEPDEVAARAQRHPPNESGSDNS